MLLSDLPASWQNVLSSEFDQPYFAKLNAFVEGERAARQVFPPAAEVFTAFHLTPYERTKVVILGQDPYHDEGQAHGLCFSVKPGAPLPPSLVNIFKELKTDVGFRPPGHGYLASWAEQGVLMLNAVLTVRAHEPNSHRAKGWETFTDAALRALNARPDRVVFVLWGAYAKKKAGLVTGRNHAVIEGVHPSPLSAQRGFFGSQPFSRINAALTAVGKPPVDWQLPALKLAMVSDSASSRLKCVHVKKNEVLVSHKPTLTALALDALRQLEPRRPTNEGDTDR